MLRVTDLHLVWGHRGPQRARMEVAAHLLQNPNGDAGLYSTYSSSAGDLLCRQLGPDWKRQYCTARTSLKGLLLRDHLKCFIIEHYDQCQYIIHLDVPRLQAALHHAYAAQQQAQQQAALDAFQWLSMWEPQPASKRLKLNNGIAVAPWMPALPRDDAGAGGGRSSAQPQGLLTRKRRLQQQDIGEYDQQQQQQQQQVPGDHQHGGAAARGLCVSSSSSSWYNQLLRVTPQACSNKHPALIDLTEPPAAWQLPLRRCLDHLSCCSLVGLGFGLAATTSPAAVDGRSGSSMEEDAAGLQLYMVQVFAPSATSSSAQGGTSAAASGSSSSRSSSVMYTSAIYLIALPEEADVRQAVVQRLLGPLLASRHLVKVAHAPQEAAAVLQQQYGVELQGVLDTQLMAEVVAAGGGGAAAAGGGSLAGSSTAAGRNCDATTSLTTLCQQYGCGCPITQRLSPQGGQEDDQVNHMQLLEKAASQVRYLLPLAAALLQQLPAADASAADAAAIAGAAAHALSRVTQQLQALSRVGPPPAGPCPQWVAGVGFPFELVLDQQRQPTYQLYIGPVEQEAPSSSTDTAATGGRVSALARIGRHNNVTAVAEAGTSTAAAVDEGVASLLELLPPCLHAAVAAQPGLLEVVIDQGRPVQLVLFDRSVIKLPSQYNVSMQQALAALGAAAAAAGNDEFVAAVSGNSLAAAAFSNVAPSAGGLAPLFGSSKRLCVAGSLHRISAIYANSGSISGLTYRVGRHMPGVGRLLLDVLAGLKASLTAGGRTESLLLLGRPGTGKTTLLRDIARLLSTSPAEGGLGLRVVVVDSSNEIAGDGPVPHPCIGDARRMMVPTRGDQAGIMIEAVENHCPDVIIVDEIGTREEAEAARTIAQRGVVLVGTAHGIELGGLMKNPDLVRLVGGVTAVTLGDAEAASSNNGKKTRLERVGAATFTRLVELQGKNRWRFHPSVEHSVDTLLSSNSSSGTPAAGEPPLLSDAGWRSRAGLVTQLRSVAPGGQLLVEFESEAAAVAAGVCAWS